VLWGRGQPTPAPELANLHAWQTCIRQTGIGELALGKLVLANLH